MSIQRVPVSRQEIWQHNGEPYGYSQCCIDAFKNMTHIGGPKRKFDGTGFIPCQSCKDNKTEAEIIAEINSKRDPSYPLFPTDFLDL